jgi:hypothetical protein
MGESVVVVVVVLLVRYNLLVRVRQHDGYTVFVFFSGDVGGVGPESLMHTTNLPSLDL